MAEGNQDSLTKAEAWVLCVIFLGFVAVVITLLLTWKSPEIHVITGPAVEVNHGNQPGN